jgi:2-C-methyl-D-erythritol 2,4-cyclodiphosphate synthase
LQIKIGMGYDLHRLESGRKLYVGGLHVPHSRGLVGHSDGDVLIHAIIDALLGAMGEGDIGRLFPDDDSTTRGIRSTKLLTEVMGRLETKKLKILGLDTVIVAETPRLAPHISAMKDVLCPLLHIGRAQLGIKAKTNEGLGLIGKRKAMACWAVALIGKN